MDIQLESKLTALPRMPEGVAQSVDRRPLADVLDRLVWWGLLSLIPLMTIVRGADEIWWQAAFECYAFGLGVLWLLAGLSKGTWKFEGASLFVPLLLLVVYALFQTVPILPAGATDIAAAGRRPITEDVVSTYRFAAELLALAIIGKLTIDQVREKQRLVLFIYVFLAVGLITAAIGVTRFIVQSTSPNKILFGYAAGEGFAQFANRNYFCLLLEMIFGLGLGFLLGGGVKREHRLVVVGALVLLMCTILLTTSRGGTLAAFTQVSFLGAWAIGRRFSSGGKYLTQWRALRHPLTRVVLGSLLVCAFVYVVGLAVLQIGGEPLAHRTDRLSLELGKANDADDGQRGDIWRATYQLIKDNPITGVGFGAYYTAIPLYHRGSGISIPSSALNDYLNLLAGGGLIAAALGLSLAIILVTRVRNGLKASSRTVRASAFGAVGGFIGVAVHSFVDAGLQVPINAVMLVTLIAIAGRNTFRVRAREANTFVPD